MTNEPRNTFRTDELPNKGVGDATQEMYDELCERVAEDIAINGLQSARIWMQAAEDKAGNRQSPPRKR